MEPSAADVLAVWERGLRQSLGDRALSLLALSEDALESPESLPAGARDAALLRIRQRLFGDRIQAVVECESCGEQLDVTLSVADLLPEERHAVHSSASIEVDGIRIEMRVPTAADVASLRETCDLETGVAELLRRCTHSAERDGRAVPVGELDPHVREALDAALSAADPGGDITLGVVCPACEAPNRPIFDCPSFLWRELQQLARDALRDVHELARAYGWSESQILGLSPVRRRFYLEAIEI
jgi:hypothetical protein